MGTRSANGRPPPPAVELGWDEWVGLVAAGDRAGPWVTLNRVLALNAPGARDREGRPDPWHLALVVEFLGPGREQHLWLPSFAELDALVDSLTHLGVAVPGGSPLEPFVVTDPTGRDEVVRGLRSNRLTVARVLRPPRGPGRGGNPTPIHPVVEFSGTFGEIHYWKPTPLSVGDVRSALWRVYRWNLENDAGGRRWRGLDPGDGQQSPWAATRWRPPGASRGSALRSRRVRNTSTGITHHPGAQRSINHYLFYILRHAKYRINRYSEVVYSKPGWPGRFPGFGGAGIRPSPRRWGVASPAGAF